ncbi:uncharacterized protein BCR38DRAFT_528676 [Pseudomassariella vexata]|uniref:Rhodopsin domain-containing protein n=1 Tax=Pseudomassariella vexata TaxID=1141098 RepID=A0A1Y2DAH0_9PEZI|nr:uncharacterized protein BCR38DRAFT_528676 [Pseudomassariella vexata]ORY56154.1 hypothetical protein BCR38DRAFT_528676 [Pseudomassariella vexata]
MSVWPYEAELQRLTVGVVTTCLVCSVISFVLRLYCRMNSAAKLWWDDYWMMLVMVVVIGLGAGGYIGLVFGSGVHQDVLDDETLQSFRKNLYALMLLWALGVFGVKIGILLFYWRAFTTSRFRIAIVVVALFSLCSFVANFFSFMFQCTPMGSFWKATDGQCFNQGALYLSSGIINVIGDAVVLFMPLPIIWTLQCSTSRKVSLTFLFLLGFFVCIASVFRIIALTQIVSEDITHTTVASGLWSAVEVQTGFICANLPFTRPLVFKCLGRSGSTASPTTKAGGTSTKTISRPVLLTQVASPGFSNLTELDDAHLLGGRLARDPMLTPPPPLENNLREEFSLSTRASVRSSLGGNIGITVRRVVASKVEQYKPGHNRIRSFQTYITTTDPLKNNEISGKGNQ